MEHLSRHACGLCLRPENILIRINIEALRIWAISIGACINLERSTGYDLQLLTSVLRIVRSLGCYLLTVGASLTQQPERHVIAVVVTVGYHVPLVHVSHALLFGCCMPGFALRTHAHVSASASGGSGWNCVPESALFFAYWPHMWVLYMVCCPMGCDIMNIGLPWCWRGVLKIMRC